MFDRIYIRFLLVAAATVISFAASARAPAQPAPGPQDLVVYSTSDTDGNLARPRCGETPILSDESLQYARQVGYYNQLVEQTRGEGRSFAPMAFHLGDSSYPGPLARFLLGEGRSGARTLTEILGQIPYVSHSLGNREAGLQHDKLVALAEGALAEKLPLRAANVVCTEEAGAEALCDALGTGRRGGPYDVVERGDVRIVAISVLDPAIKRSIAKSRLRGLDILDPAELLKRLVPRARGTVNPDLVFLQLHTGPGTGVEEIVELTHSVSGIDVVFTEQQLGSSSETERSRTNGYVVAPKSGAFIVPTGRSERHATVTRLRVGRSSETGDWSVRDVENDAVDTSSAAADPRTAELLWRASEQLCRRWGKPIAENTPLAQPFEREDFVTFVLNVMRLEAKADVAISNDGAFLESEFFPLKANLTYFNVNAGLPYENPMVIARMRGEQLAEVADKVGRSAVAVGLEASGTDYLVNGRPLRPDRIYRVAMNRYTAEGGDAILEPDQLQQRETYDPEWGDEAPPISDIVVHFIQAREHVRYGAVDTRLSPTGNFPDLHRRLLWQLVGSLTVSYDEVTVQNPERGGESVYNQSQLNVDSTRQLNIEGAFQANADSRNHGWDNSLLVQYGTTRNQSAGELEQNKDLIRAKSLYKYAGYRARLGGQWWAPMPTAELQIESEFDPPEERPRQKIELTGILGSSFQLWPPFEIKLGFDVRRDVNQPRDRTVFGVTGAYKLTRFNLVEVVESPIRFESEFEYFYNAPFDERIHELRSTSRAFYSLFEELNVTTTFSTFLYRSGFVGSFGRNTEFTVGLNYLWDETYQTY